jgi:tetratricopeptide (TPR) repeat protein
MLGDESSSAAADLAVLYETGRDPANATGFFLQAARSAARVFAYPEAVILCQRGLAQLALLPDGRDRDSLELMFSLTLGLALMATQGYATTEVERTHLRSRELCLKLGETQRLLSALWGLHTCETNRGDLTKALEIAREMEQAARAMPGGLAMTEALFAAGSTLGFMGRWSEARETLEPVLQTHDLATYTGRGTRYVLDPCVGTLSMMARILTFTGHFDEAREKAKQAIQLAQRLMHPPSLAYATFWLGFVHHAMHEYEESVQPLETAIALSSEQGLALFVEWGRVVLGSTLTRMGSLETGIAEMRKSIERQPEMRSSLERAYCLTLLAEALQSNGESSEALALCNEALDFARRTEARCYEPETHRVRAEILCSNGRAEWVAEGKIELQLALSTAQNSGCRLLELRTALSFSRLSQDSADRHAALDAALAGVAGLGEPPLVDEARRALLAARG